MMGKIYQRLDNQVKAEQLTFGIADAPLKGPEGRWIGLEEGMTKGRRLGLSKGVVEEQWL